MGSYGCFPRTRQPLLTGQGAACRCRCTAREGSGRPGERIGGRNARSARHCRRAPSGTSLVFLIQSALATVETDFLSTDRYLYEHRTYYVREMRLRAYSQLLQSYRIVSLESIAKSFGVSVEWLDKDLAVFIAGGRLGCVIDRVRGVIETRRGEEKEGEWVRKSRS